MNRLLKSLVIRNPLPKYPSGDWQLLSRSRSRVLAAKERKELNSSRKPDKGLENVDDEGDMVKVENRKC